jgi:hypothetical protein
MSPAHCRDDRFGNVLFTGGQVELAADRRRHLQNVSNHGGYVGAGNPASGQVGAQADTPTAGVIRQAPRSKNRVVQPTMPQRLVCLRLGA